MRPRYPTGARQLAPATRPSCFRSVGEGCAMASVLGMMEEREAAVRVRVEGLREEVARLAGVLEAAEIELDRRVIAREELVEALAASAAETTAVTGTEAGQEPCPRARPCRCRARSCRLGARDCR